MILSEEWIVTPFCLQDSEETNQILQDSELSSFLMDFTFCCCREGLVLGSVGPVGLRRGPSMRFFPVVLVVSIMEDEDAQVTLLNLWFKKCHDLYLAFVAWNHFRSNRPCGAAARRLKGKGSICIRACLSDMY